MQLTHRRQTLRPKYTFATSQWAVDEKETIVVELMHDGMTGLGEATPAALYGQSLEATEAALNRAGALLGDDPFAIEAIVARLIEHLDSARDAIAAVDNALHDWVGKRLGVPVWRLLGLDPARTQTTFTIGLAEPEEIRVKVAEALESGYTALKIKVGNDNDHDTLAHIRAHFDGPLLLDANQAWTPEDAPDKIRALAQFKPAMIEQPLRAADWRQMADLLELGVAPIFADESCERPADVVRLHGCVDGVNIKFNKCGGIREALRMITLARGLGMQVMLGCFVCSSVAIAPPLHIASLVDFADLDGHLLLGQDPYRGIEQEGSTIWIDPKPGLGVEPA